LIVHYCPECGQACYCGGDIDDCPVYADADGPAWCTCPSREDGCNRDNEPDDDYDGEPDCEPDAGLYDK
jgi:hypothetical protein